MEHTAELEFLVKILRRMRLQTVCIEPFKMQKECLDLGLRKFLGMGEGCGELLGRLQEWLCDNTIYKITDELECRYMLLKLPEENSVLLIGPYLSEEKTKESIFEEAARYNVQDKLRQLEICYAAIPAIADENILLTLLNVFGETLWGGRMNFEVTELECESCTEPHSVARDEDSREAEEIMMHMRAIEERYAYENELIETVAQGFSHRAELMVSSFTKGLMEHRAKDRLRDVKNYCIICNTLMRKAAEKGGVHPMHIDSASSAIAKRIESVGSFNDGKELMKEVIRTYCRLVKKNHSKQYAPFVRKTVAYIESDLAGDLSLHKLAQLQNINASYLSTLFHKETGKTITEFVNEKRMELASHLLGTTQMQIQTVARHCGMSDVNYFSKIFKKIYGVTPRQYREENRAYITK